MQKSDIYHIYGVQENCNINFFDMLTRWLMGRPNTDH